MADFIKSFRNLLKGKDVVFTLIIINVMVFLVCALLRVIGLLFEIPYPDLSVYFEVSSNIGIVIRHIWTLITYMFLHYDVLHILFNMLMLYWFGIIFRSYFTPKHMVAVYILGGIAAALFYILTFNTIPYFIKLGSSSMIGASGAVTAIIFAAAFYNKNLQVGLLFFGRIKIIYIALFIFVLDFIALGGGNNTGGHVAHIGGALFGYLFATQYLKGRDITKWFNMVIDKVVNLFKPSPRMRVTYRKEKTDEEYNQQRHNTEEQIDAILDKIKQSGYSSLSSDEKKKLFDASNK
ncbi:rhomboid family protein [Dysgonomonas macrotermitis]|uniref:Membrane associated serine protease, rhomboid family n=1 Tax=Dysgonomonas macrotermitis TaxID=1346286 RepID=A0A1M5D8H0_9BACT|nr:rhomboid family intramembrane serine protease [Dysgonomonas macrotermitis]SHF63306.1 Membrane associated serine protease, rhomboid family [Dysgonomonas macrotermitis]